MYQYPAPSPPYIGPPNNHGGPTNKPIDHVVIHSTVSPCVPGGARNIAYYFKNTDRDASAHYITDPEEVIQGLYDGWVGYAAPPNEHKLHVEMCDIPGPVPDVPRSSTRYQALKKSWRWVKPNQQKMLRKTAYLTARLCLAHDIPMKWVGVRAIKRGKRGITTHDVVSRAFKQSNHWDPGWWPRIQFIIMVNAYAKGIKKRHRIRAQRGE